MCRRASTRRRIIDGHAAIDDDVTASTLRRHGLSLLSSRIATRAGRASGRCSREGCRRQSLSLPNYASAAMEMFRRYILYDDISLLHMGLSLHIRQALPRCR